MKGKFLRKYVHCIMRMYCMIEVKLNLIGITGKNRVYTQTVRVNIPFTNHLKAACL